MSDKKINPEHLYNTLAGKLARRLDAMDSNPNDGQIEASVWNEFVSDKGGKTIRESIDIGLAMNSITTYCVMEGAKDNGKTGTEKAKEWDVGLDELVISGSNTNVLNEVEVVENVVQDNSANKPVVVDPADKSIDSIAAKNGVIVTLPVVACSTTVVPNGIPVSPEDVVNTEPAQQQSRTSTKNPDGTQTITRFDKNGEVKKSRVSLSWNDIGNISETSVKDFFKGMVCDDDGKVNGWKIAGTIGAIAGMAALTWVVGAAAAGVVAAAGAGTALAGLSTATGAAAGFATLATGTMLLKPLIEGGTEKTINGATAYYTAQSKEEAEQAMKEQMDGVVELASVPVLGRIFKWGGKLLNKTGIKNSSFKGKEKVKVKESSSKPSETGNEVETSADGKPTVETSTDGKPAPVASKVETSADGKPTVETPAENKTTTKPNMFGVTKVRDGNGNVIKKTRKSLFHGEVTKEYGVVNGQRQMVRKTYRNNNGFKVTDEYEYNRNLSSYSEERILKERITWAKANENQIFKTEEYSMNGKNKVVTTTQYKYDSAGNAQVESTSNATYRPNSNKLLNLVEEKGTGKKTTEYDVNGIKTKQTSINNDGSTVTDSNFDPKLKSFTAREVKSADGKVENFTYKANKEGVYDWVKAENSSSSAAAPKVSSSETSEPQSELKKTPETETPKTETGYNGMKKGLIWNKEYSDGKIVQKSRKRLFGGKIVKKFDDKGKLIGKSKTYKDTIGRKFTEEYDYTSGKKVLKKKTFWNSSNENQIMKAEEYNISGESRVVTTTLYTSEGKAYDIYTDTYQPHSDKLLSRVGKNEIAKYEYTVKYDENGIQIQETEVHSQYTDIYSDYDSEGKFYSKCTREYADGEIVNYELRADADGEYSWVEVTKPA